MPADPRVWAMTAEQVSDLFLQIEHLHPVDEVETLRDPDFAAEVEKLAQETQDVIWADTVVEPAPGAPVAAEWEPIDVTRFP